MGAVTSEFASRGGDTGQNGAAVRLPPRRSSFVGRAAELGEIATRLERYAVVTLTGVGGVGKTALAVEAAWIEVSAGRAELVCYVDLVPCRTDEQVAAALVEGVGVRGAVAAAGLDAVAEAVSGCRSLLVLDNCEHVLESARRACDQLAQRAADLRPLVTSRIPLDVEPECVWRVQPMTVPGEAGHEVATEAVTLFFARAAMAGVTLRDGPGELALVGGICRQAGGLPLAIELVANRLRVASLTELAEELGRSGWPARPGSGRHDSLDACLAWSHALLPADAAAVFRRLSVFPGGFDLAAAAEVAGTPPVGADQVGGLVEQLVTASLVEADTSGIRTRFRFHEPVRQYAAARLSGTGEEDLTRWRHARAFLARVEAIEPMMFAPQAEHHCDLLEFDRPDHDAALGWFLSRGAAAEAQRLAAALYFFWYTRGWFVTGQHAREAIDVARRANSAINVMIATGHLGRILLASGEPDAARHLDQAVQLARTFAVRPLLAWWLDSLGELAELEGRYGDAQSWYEQAAGHATESGLAADAGRARHHIGRLAWMRGDRASAVNSCHEALAGQLEAGDRVGLVETLETLGGLLIDERHAQRGLPLLAAATSARDRMGFPVRPMEADRIAGWVATGREHLGEQAQAAWKRGAALSIEEAASMARRGRGPRRRPAFGWPSLTPAERNVADLVARGLTNPEIAARLGVSAGTVKDQVSSALRKLGVRTRAELAAAVSSQPGI